MVVNYPMPKLSLWQKIKLQVLGYVYLYEEQRPGWTGKLPMYLVKCKKHKYLYIDYPHGFPGGQFFSCPKCLDGA